MNLGVFIIESYKKKNIISTVSYVCDIYIVRPSKDRVRGYVTPYFFFFLVPRRRWLFSHLDTKSPCVKISHPVTAPRGVACPPMVFFFFFFSSFFFPLLLLFFFFFFLPPPPPLVNSAIGHGHDNTPT